MKRIVSLLLAIMLMLSLVACGGNDSGKTDGKQPDNSGNVSQPGGDGEKDPGGSTVDTSKYEVTEPVTFQFWHAFGAADRQQMLQDIADAFHETHPLITVEPYFAGSYGDIDLALIAAQTAGTGYPGLAAINYPLVINYGESGVSEPLDEYAAASGTDLSDFVDGLLSPLVVNGETHGLPFVPYSAAVYYNQDMLDELNIPVPETWEDMKEMAKKVYEEKGIPGFGLASNTNFVNHVFVGTGVDPIDNINDPRIEEWVKDFRDQVKLGYMEYLVGPDADTTTRTAFTAGMYASVIDTTNASMQIQKLCDFTAEVRLYRGVGTISGGAAIIPAINDQNTKNAAWQFLEFLTNAENALTIAKVVKCYPYRKSIVENPATLQQLVDDCPPLDDVFPHLDQIIAKNPSEYYTKAMNKIKNAFGQIVNEGADFDSTWAQLNKDLEQVFAGN